MNSINLFERNRHAFSITCLLLYSSVFLSQESTGKDKTNDSIKRPAYLTIGVGVGHSYFRDFSTSPLIYMGNPLMFSLSHIDLDDERESSIAPSYAFGKFENAYNQQLTESAVNVISLHYLELFQLRKLSSSKINLKLGGQLSSSMVFRNNAELLNNKQGVDIIANLMLSVKGTINLDREEKNNRFLFVNYKLNKRKQNLSYQLNFGVVNTSYRNGFIYTSPSAPLNSDDFFAGYELRVLRGFRISSVLNYTFFLKNKNAIQLSYLWDAYHTGGHHNNFEMASHILQCSILFNLK